MSSAHLMNLITSQQVLQLLDKRRPNIEIRDITAGNLLTVATIFELTRALTMDPINFVGNVNKHGYLRSVVTPLGLAHVRRLTGQSIRPASPLCAEDNYTVVRDGRTFVHHRMRSYAYARQFHAPTARSAGTA